MSNIKEEVIELVKDLINSISFLDDDAISEEDLDEINDAWDSIDDRASEAEAFAIELRENSDTLKELVEKLKNKSG